MSRLYRWPLWTLAAVALLLVLAGATLHVMLLQVPERRTQIQHWINGATGLDLRLGKLAARWRLTGPELYAANVEVFTPRGEIRLARAREVRVRVDLWRMMSRAQLLAGRIRLIEPEVRFVRTAQGRIELEGQSQLRKRGDGHLNSDALPSGVLRILDARITLLDATDGQTLAKLQGVDLKLERNRDKLRFAGGLELTNALGRSLQFSGAASGRLDDLANLSWTTTLRGRDLHLAAWGPLFGGRWRTLNPEGEIGSLDIGVSRDARRPAQLKGAARFARLGFNPVDRWPGVRGLSGDISATGDSGTARLSSQGLTFSMPYRFREPVVADRFAGDIAWTREEDGLRLQSRQLQGRNAHASGSVDLDLFLPADRSSPILKLQGRFQDAVLKEGWRYLPVDRLRSEKTRAWLDAAFLSGRAPSGEILIEGPTRKFPFRNGEGEFRVRFPVEDLQLHYGKDWPDIENLAADIEFHNQGLVGIVRGGTLKGLKLEEGGRAEFADLKTGELTVRGRATGDLGAALNFLQESPIGPSFGETFAKLTGQGPTSAELDLFLPVKRLADRKVKLTAQLDRSRLQLEDAEHVLRNIRGTLRYEDKQLFATGLMASWLGGSMRIDLKPEKVGRQGPVNTMDNVVRVRARTPAPALAQALLPEAVKLSGTVDWRAVARVPIKREGEERALRFRVDSTLAGTGIDLPAPLNKAPADIRPLRIEAQWPNPQSMSINASYSTVLRSQLEFAKPESDPNEKTGWRLARGAIRLGESDLRMPAEGLQAAGALDALDLSGWLSLRSGKPGSRPISSYLRSVDLTVHDLEFYSFHLPDVSGTLKAADNVWSVTVDGPRARGTLQVPFDMKGTEPLVVNMAHLSLPEPAKETQMDSDERRSKTDPRKWPSVKIAVTEFEAWNKKFGVLHAELARVPAGLELRSLGTQAPSFALSGSGTWTASEPGQTKDQSSRLTLRLDSTDVLQTLQDLGYGASLTGKIGHATLDLSWSGAPNAQLLKRINGTVAIAVDSGQLVGVQPGAGRVFGLMSIATLRRRLSLDFSDLTDKGLAFDSIRGDFTLKEGNAYTSNLLLKGPAAEIGVVGRTGLVTHDYNQTAVVTGSIGQSLPVAGALAGGPAVGAALLLFSQIFKQPLKGIARGYYRITGPWEEPTVRRVDANELNAAEIAVSQ